jgi:hypothetical protein
MSKVSMTIIATFISLFVFATEPTAPGPTSSATTPDNCESSLEKIGHDAFMNAPGLTEAQKIKLGQIMKATYAETQKIKFEIATNKVDLFDAITSPLAKASDVNTLKKKLTELDKKRLALMFKSLDEVQKVIGKNAETGKFLRSLMKEKMKADEHTK